MRSASGSERSDVLVVLLLLKQVVNSDHAPGRQSQKLDLLCLKYWFLSQVLKLLLLDLGHRASHILLAIDVYVLSLIKYFNCSREGDFAFNDHVEFIDYITLDDNSLAFLALNWGQLLHNLPSVSIAQTFEEWA